MNQLFTNQTSNASSSSIDWSGGEVKLIAAGTWDTSTLKLQVSPDGGTTWLDSGTSATADIVTSKAVPQGAKIRLNLSSVGGSTDISAWVGD